jgi:hypothetical protein
VKTALISRSVAYWKLNRFTTRHNTSVIDKKFLSPPHFAHRKHSNTAAFINSPKTGVRLPAVVKYAVFR